MPMTNFRTRSATASGCSTSCISWEFDSKNEDYLKEALRALTTCALEWNVLDKDGFQEWGVTTLLAETRIKNGICTYAYGPTLRERLYTPSMYARINLSMQNKFGSKHAQALWEICVGLPQLPETSQRTLPLFPDLEDMPLAVKELKDAGLSPKDAWAIWQDGFDIVEPAVRPAIDGDSEAAFARYIREKIDLLKRRQASGKLSNRTIFLLKAIKKNYVDPDFTDVEKQKTPSARQRKAA